MKKAVSILSLIFLSSNVYAKTAKFDVVCTNPSGVAVRIEMLGYDVHGALFRGTITKNGHQVRNSLMRMSSGSELSVYTLSKNGSLSWRFTFRNLQSAYIIDGTDNGDILSKIGLNNRETDCGKDIPVDLLRR